MLGSVEADEEGEDKDVGEREREFCDECCVLGVSNDEDPVTRVPTVFGPSIFEDVNFFPFEIAELEYSSSEVR